MNKEQTAMQELIERIDNLFKIGKDDAGLRTCKQIATELLPKGREQIEAAHMDGQEYSMNLYDEKLKLSSATNYFTKKYT